MRITVFFTSHLRPSHPRRPNFMTPSIRGVRKSYTDLRVDPCCNERWNFGFPADWISSCHVSPSSPLSPKLTGFLAVTSRGCERGTAESPLMSPKFAGFLAVTSRGYGRGTSESPYVGPGGESSRGVVHLRDDDGSPSGLRKTSSGGAKVGRGPGCLIQ